MTSDDVVEDRSSSARRGWEHRREREEFAAQNIPLEYLPLWEVWKDRFKGTPHERYESFMEFAQSEDGQQELLTITQGSSDEWLKKELRRKDREWEPWVGPVPFESRHAVEGARTMAFEYTTEPETIVTIYDDEALQAMQGWWAGQGDPLYAIYSNGGEAPVHVIEHAISNLESDIARVKKLGRDQFKLGQGTFTKAEIGELYAIRDALVGALENRGEIQERRPTVPAFQRPGVRVRYAYTDGPVRAGTLGTIEGWLPTPYKAQIRWNNGTMSSHTPDEYEVIRRTATEESHGEALELEAGTGSDKARWDTLRAQFLAADEAARAQEIAMRVKWGDAGWRNWASRGERTKLDKLLERRNKIGNKLFELLLRVSPRGEAWRTGAPAFWIYRDLTWEDAIRPANEPLSVVVPAPYGASHGITEHGVHEQHHVADYEGMSYEQWLQAARSHHDAHVHDNTVARLAYSRGIDPHQFVEMYGGFALEEGGGGLLAVRLDDPKFPGNGGVVVAHPKSAAEFEKLIERRDGARDPNMRLWRGNAPIGTRVSLDGGPTLKEGVQAAGGVNFHVNFQRGERLRIRVKGPDGQPLEAFWFTVDDTMSLNEVALRFAQTAQAGMLIEVVSGKLKWTFQVERFAGQPSVKRVRGTYTREGRS